jgi:hypothetical protein
MPHRPKNSAAADPAAHADELDAPEEDVPERHIPEELILRCPQCGTVGAHEPRFASAAPGTIFWQCGICWNTTLIEEA